MSTNTGNKVSMAEYTARAVINIAEKAAAPLLTLGATYVVYFHGHEIAAWTRNKINNRKRK